MVGQFQLTGTRVMSVLLFCGAMACLIVGQGMDCTGTERRPESMVTPSVGTTATPYECIQHSEGKTFCVLLHIIPHGFEK